MPEQALEVLPELRLPVVLGDLDAEALQIRDVGGQPGQRLASATSDSDQKRVTPRLHQHAVNAADVQQRIFEEHQVHGGVPGFHGVVFEFFGEHILQFFGVGDYFVRRVFRVASKERDERRALAVEGKLVSLAEECVPPAHQVLVQLLVELLLEPSLVVHVPHPVAEDAEALVHPQLEHGLPAVVVLPGRLHGPLDHLGEVSRVEQVVGLRRRRQELLGDVEVELDGGFRDRIAQRLDRVVELRQLIVEQGAVDAVQLLVGRVCHVQHGEDGHDALRERVAPTARRRHRRHELDVLDGLNLLLLSVVPESVIHPQLEQLERRHEPEDRLLRHVEVVDVHDHLLTAAGRKHAFAALLEAAFDRVLQRVAAGLRGKVDDHGALTLGKGLEA